MDLKKQMEDSNEFGTATTTNMQSKPTTKTLVNLTNQQISEKSIQKEFLNLICYVRDFLVKHSVLLENGQAFMIPEEHCFLRLQELLKINDLHIYSLKTLRGYSITMKGKLLPQSYERWMNWGIIVNGWYLTANFLECHRTENVCSLSGVLEKKVDKKYFLSGKSLERLKTVMNEEKLPHQDTSYAIDASYHKGADKEFITKGRRQLIEEED